MVKIPKFSELKKMGEDLANSAKNTKFIDKLKSSVDSLGAGSATVDNDSDEAATTAIQRCLKLLNELQEVKRIEANLFNQLKTELNQMAKTEQATEAETKQSDEH